MTASISNRKRSRDEDGNYEDHMPLSKRINMLHINNNNHNGVGDSNQQQHNIDLNGNSHNGNHHHHQEHHHHSQMNHNEHNQQQLQHHHQNGHLIDIGSSSHIDIEDNSTYNPELNQIENPYYYNKNKLLFELHLERSKRNTTDKI